MIEVRQEPLPLKSQDDLNHWLGLGAFSLLVKVAEARVKIHAAASLGHAVQAAQGSPLKYESANDDLQKASRYATFLDVLKEFHDQKEPFVTVKLS